MRILGKKRSVRFNDNDLTQFMAVERIHRPMMAGRSNEWSSPLGGTRYQQHRRSQTEPYKVIIEGTIFGNSAEDVRVKASNLAHKVVSDRPAELITDDTGRYEMAILDGSVDTSDVQGKIKKVKLTFLVNDGASRSPSIEVSGSTGTNSVVNNPGQLPTPFTALLTFTAAKSSGFSMVLGSRFVRVLKPLPINSQLLIDTEKELVLYRANATASWQDWRVNLDFLSDFMDLEPGANTVELQTGVQHTITFTPRWR